MTKQPLAKDLKGEFFRVDSRRLIFEDGYNEREDFGNIEELARSIAAGGIKTALVCYKRGENYIVKRGHRRTLALRILEKKGDIIMVPVLSTPRNYNPEEAVLDLIVENDSLPFSPWEQAKVLRRLRNFGWSDKDMAEKSGKALVYVRRLLSLADAPQKLINLVREGRVKGTFAMDMIAEGRVQELIEKAEQSADPVRSSDFLEMFPSESVATPPKAPRITRGDLTPNSWKHFRKWSSKIDEKELSPKKAEIFNWLTRMAEGELTENDFNDFFR